MQESGVALCGYVTADIVAHSAEAIRSKGTNFIEMPATRWPRAGGAPFYAGRALLMAGHRAIPISFIGDDLSGEMFTTSARLHDLPDAGVVVARGERTPTCFLVDAPDGDICCLLDKGSLDNQVIDPRQSILIASARWVVVAAGPPILTSDVLDRLTPDQKLAWIVKLDQHSFPQELRARLAARASVVFCNRGEREFLDSTRSVSSADQTIFETDGERGVRISWHGGDFALPTDRVIVRDTVGAGDTFAGGALSVLINDETALELAASKGMRAAANLLGVRSEPSAVSLTLTS